MGIKDYRNNDALKNQQQVTGVEVLYVESRHRKILQTIFSEILSSESEWESES